MHVVLGDGQMTRKELTETLNDLWERSVKAEEPYWFLLQGKSEPTETDTNIVTWLHKNNVYYEVITDDAESMADIYEQSQETHVAKRLSQKIVNLLNTKPEEGENADVMALFASDDPKAEEDRWVNTVLQAAVEAGFKAIAFNDGLMVLDLSATPVAAEAEPEEEPETEKPIKKAARPAPLTEVLAEYTREQLGDMELPELKEIAAAKGIELAPRTRMSTYIDKILGEDKDVAPPVEVTTPPVTVTTEGNGDIDLARVAEEAAAIVIEKIVAALQA